MLMLSILFFAASCSTNKNTNHSQNKQSKYMYELAINQSKEGQHQTFLDTRAKFV